MLSRYSKINKYGGHTWHIEMESLYHIFIHETETSSFIIECKEWKWLAYKTHFSFVSDKTLEQTIIDSFARVYDFVSNKSAAWSYQSQAFQLRTVLDLLSKHHLSIKPPAIPVIKENGAYIAHLTGNNPDTNRYYEFSEILIFKGSECIHFEEEGKIAPGDISINVLKYFDDPNQAGKLSFEVMKSMFSMRSYKTEHEWNEWSGKVVNEGLVLSLNAHVFNWDYRSIMDHKLYNDAEFKFFSLH